jgi:hypothetical protein
MIAGGIDEEGLENIISLQASLGLKWGNRVALD